MAGTVGIHHRASGQHYCRTGPTDYPHGAHHGGERMNITFTPEPIPELILAGNTLATLGFTCGTPLQLTLQNHTLWITPVTDEAVWEQLCKASQHRQDLGAGERRVGDCWRLAHRVRYYRRGTTGSHRRPRCYPVAAAGSGRILGLEVRTPASWPGLLLLQDIVELLIPVKSNVLLLCLLKDLNNLIKTFAKTFP